ncbi:hypothetical protein D3C76_885810 [compost metagenome]
MQQVVAAFLPDVGIARGAAGLGGVAGQAAIEGVVVAHEVAFEGDLRGVIDLPADDRGDIVAFAFDIVAEAVAAFTQYVQAVGQRAVLAQRPGGIKGGTVHALVVELAAKGDLGLGQRLLADHVERTAGVATAVQAAGRATDDLQALDGVGIRSIGVAAVDRKAVAIELPGREATHGEGCEALAAEVVGAADTTGVVQAVLQARGARVYQHILGHHADRLRGFVQRRVGAGGTGRAGGLVAIDRAVGAFTVGSTGDAQGLEFDLVRVAERFRLGKGQRGDSMKHTKRNERAAHRQYGP